jgi:hypothetical protein
MASDFCAVLVHRSITVYRDMPDGKEREKTQHHLPGGPRLIYRE